MCKHYFISKKTKSRVTMSKLALYLVLSSSSFDLPLQLNKTCCENHLNIFFCNSSDSMREAEFYIESRRPKRALKRSREPVEFHEISSDDGESLNLVALHKGMVIKPVTGLLKSVYKLYFLNQKRFCEFYTFQ